jgi:hypothetical protein
MPSLFPPHRLLVAALLLLVEATARGDEKPAARPPAPPGTPFVFEIVECLDAAYLGDTPSHVGRSGGLEFRPHVALGDPVYRVVGEGESRRSVRMGRVSHVTWERVSGSLTIEVDPDPLARIAVGDELWIDLNPASTDDAPAPIPAPPAP